MRLLSGFGVVRLRGRDQASDESTEEGLAATSGVVDDLKEAAIGGKLLLRDAAVRPQPGTLQRPEALGRVDVDLADPSPSSSRAYSPRLWQTVWWS
jgi:hypothetical protein